MPTRDLIVRSGPDVPLRYRLGPGRHVLGRAATAAVQLDDPELEPHHVEVVIDATDDTVDIVGLTGRPPQPFTSGPVCRAMVWTVADTTFEIGPMVDHGRRRRVSGPIVVRPLRRLPVDPGSAIAPVAAARAAVDDVAHRAPSAPGGGAIGLLGAAMSVVVAVVMAFVIGQVMFLLFAVSGVVVAVVNWVSARRRHRRQRRQHEAERRTAEEHLATTLMTVGVAVDRAHRAAVPWVAERLALVETERLWERRRAHGDAFTVTIGEGRSEYTGDGGEVVGLDAVAVPVDLTAHRVIGVTGPYAAGVIRSMIAQLAVQAGPADWVLADRCHRPLADGLRSLPHLVDDDQMTVMVTAAGPQARAHLVVIGDDDDELTRPGTELRRLIDVVEDLTVITLIADPARVPAACDAVVHTGHHALGRVEHRGGSSSVRIAGVSAATVDAVTARLAGLVDPEAATESGLPDRADLGGLIPTTAAGVAEAWARFDPCGGSLPAVVGVDDTGPFVVDVVADGPHGLIAGTTGSGKSEFLRTLVVSLATTAPPDEVNVVLVDYKGGATFDACVDLPHTVGVVTDLDDGLAERALISLEAELRHRELLLRRHGVGDRRDYAALRLADPTLEPLPRLVVIIDEFATMVREVPGFISALVGVAQRGRSLGLHLLLATQRPAGVLDDAIRANTDLRIALRVNDVADAHDVVGSPVPAGFARRRPGRAMVRCGPDEATVVQTASSAELIHDVVAAVVAAAATGSFPTPRRPWLPAVDEIDPDELRALCAATPGAIGIIDDPAGQRRLPVIWERSGNLALIGSVTSSASATMVAVIAPLVAAGMTVSMIDAVGTTRIAGTAGVDDHERVDRLLGEWCSEIDRRRQDGDRRSDRVLAVDGLVPLVRSLDDRPGSRHHLDRILGEGPGVGIVVVATIDSGRGASFAGRFAERWVFPLDDPSDGLLFGLPVSAVPKPDRAGNVFVIAATRLMARVDLESVAADALELTAVGALGSDISDVDAFAVAFDDLLPMTPTIEPARRGDEHVMILGPPRSGRTTAVRTLVGCLARHHPEREIIWCRDAAAILAVERPAVIVVDDVEAIDDDDGSLGRWLDEPVAGRLVIAAGRPDVLRARYGHWTAGLRRSRRGLIMAATADTDADLLGVVPPRVTPIRPRPGLGWWIEPDGSAPDLVQVIRNRDGAPSD